MHLLAEREILTALKEGGLLRGEVEEMLDFRIGALFMPHGEPLSLTCVRNDNYLQQFYTSKMSSIDWESTSVHHRPILYC